LEGVHSISHPYPKFVAFFLTVETVDDKNADESGKKALYEGNPGRFIIVEPALSQISRTCLNTVVNTNTMEKSKVVVGIKNRIIKLELVKFKETKKTLSDSMGSAFNEKRLRHLSIYVHRPSYIHLVQR
jgi:hypothetical protein